MLVEDLFINDFFLLFGCLFVELLRMFDFESEGGFFFYKVVFY